MTTYASLEHIASSHLQHTGYPCGQELARKDGKDAVKSMEDIERGEVWQCSLRSLGATLGLLPHLLSKRGMLACTTSDVAIIQVQLNM